MIKSINDLKQYINNSEKYKNFEILDTEFISSTSKLKVHHKKCGNIIYMSSHDFITGHNCKFCSKKAESARKSITQTNQKQNRRSAAQFIETILCINPDFKFDNLDKLKNGESIIQYTHICGVSGSGKAKYFLKRHKCKYCSRKKNLVFDKDKHKNIEIVSVNGTIVTYKCLKCNSIHTIRKDYANNLGSECNKCHREGNFANKVYAKYNGEYKYVSGYINDKTNVILHHNKCNKDFLIRPSHFLYDNATCTKCAEYKNEKIVEEYLKSLNIPYEKQKTFPDCRDKQKLLFDFYLPAKNLIIEYDGEQHFYPVFGDDIFKITCKHDDIKNKFCIDNNINIIRIPYWMKKNITEIVNKIVYDDITEDNLYLSFETNVPKKVQRLSWKGVHPSGWK